MKTVLNWKDDDFILGIRFPGIGKSLSTTNEEHIAAQAKLELQKAEYFARGGSVTLCPPCTCSSDEVVAEINKARSKAVAEANAARAA